MINLFSKFLRIWKRIILINSLTSYMNQTILNKTNFYRIIIYMKNQNKIIIKYGILPNFGNKELIL